MFKKYGVIGIILIVLVELNFFFEIQPFANFYFPFVWIGYILVIDALVYKLKKNSLISNRLNTLIGMAILSIFFWWLIEVMNIGLKNWSYIGTENLGILRPLHRTIAYATVLPAFFETVELIRSIHLFDNKHLDKHYKINKKFLHYIIGFGVVFFVLHLFLPLFAYPLVWLSFFFILDPINYLHKQPSVIGYLRNGKLTVPLSLLLGGIVMGFFWEFWNYWAVVKWTYDVPFIGFFKIFEMPILGYLGYFPFALELFAMYWFVRSLLVKKEKMLLK